MKLLCLADVHLGRHPGRLPTAFQGADLNAAAAWRRAVDFAVREQVDAVLLAGDLIDDQHDYFEAFSDLSLGAQRLAEAGIRVLAVSGNHDVSVLPRLVEAVPNVQLLGSGGCWEAAAVNRAGDEGGNDELYVVGWSFPQAHVTNSPLDTDGVNELKALTAKIDPAKVIIGLLHCDRDQTDSRYAPVRSSDLTAAPVGAWLLGHVHKPDFAASEDGRPSGYLGSLAGNDPGEPGPRGAWLMTVAGGDVTAEHVPLAPLRWEVVDIDISGLGQEEELPSLIVAAVDDLHQRLQQAGSQALAVGCRFTLSGRSHLRSELESFMLRDDPRDLVMHKANVAYFVDEVRLTALPALPLREMAAHSDPLGLLASRVLALQDADSPERGRLIAAAGRRLAEVDTSRPFLGLSPEPLDDEQIAELLLKAALNVIDELAAQRPTRNTTEGREQTDKRAQLKIEPPS